MKNKTFHKSVLIKEVIQYLDPQPNKIYVDATFGGGGHTLAILNKEQNCTVVAIDWDKEALENASSIERTNKYHKNLNLIWGNFSQLYKLLKKINIKKIDGIIADFGTSQFQIHQKAGFSFQTDTYLDMRMSPAHQKITAADILNKTPEKVLAQIFFKYGEEKFSKKIAREIVTFRKSNSFKTTNQLVILISKIKPAREKTKINPATKIFQALRIIVNKELENIEKLLRSSIQLLNKNGRMVFISFHSLEDRIVKNFFKENIHKLEILTPKSISADKHEVAQNPSSRSAKLRAAKKIV